MSPRTTRTPAGPAGGPRPGLVRRTRSLRRLALLAAVPVVLAGCSLGDGDPQGGGAQGGGTQGGTQGGTETTEATAEPSADPSVTVPPAPELASYYAQELTWVGCENIDPPEGVTGQDHECTTVQVPLDYDAPGEGSLLLSLVRLPATGERLGSLLVNPGGPGGSGVDYALSAGVVTTDEVRERYDVVGFDPRGVARSSGLDCLDDAETDAYTSVDISPDDAGELAELETLAEGLAQGCADDRVTPYVDTVSTVRDMDVLRAVLGDADLAFLGKSYGTVLGAVYAELFPDRVGRLVLDGAVDLTRPASDPTLSVEQARGFETALESFVADCATQSDCPLTGTVDDGVAQVGALLQSLDRVPLPTGDDERPLTQNLGLSGIVGPLYYYDFWPALRAGLGGALEGDGEVLLFLADTFAERREDGTYRTNFLEAFVGISCTDDSGGSGERPTFADLQAAQALLAEEAPTFGAQFGYGSLPCLSWPFEPVPYPEVDGEGAPEILVIGTTRDPATPLVWAERLADQLASGVLVTFDGDGHTAYAQTGSACVDEAVDAFLVEGTVPEDGLACVADY